LMRHTAGQPGCDRAVDAQQVAAYAEQNLTYVGVHGVCAGPQALIDEYLRVLLDGQSAPIQAEPDVASRLGDLVAAIDYGLIGQRIESLIRTYGASQTLALLRLRAALQGRAHHARLSELLERPIDAAHFPLLRDIHPLRETLELEIGVNRWLFARAGEALPEQAGWEPVAETNASERSQLAEFLARALPWSICEEVASAATEVLALERSCLRAVRSEQERLNERLGRPSGRVLTADDLTVYTKPRSGPSLARILADALDLTITTDAAASVLSCQGQSLTLSDSEPRCTRN
jgi:hypothetical protein